MRNSRIIMSLALSLAAACSGFAVRGQQTPFGSGTGMEPTPSRGVSASTARAGSRSGTSVKRVCRGNSQPGWIAIDFVADSTGCGGLHTTKYPVAIVAYYLNLPVETELEVCDTERVPTGWIFEHYVDDNASCPDDNANGHSTVKLIRRIS